jgi:ATP-dependent helicase/nuclease subunit A
MTDISASLLNQRAAADPGRSVWLAANAGSGKTRVLIDRVARLLLAGCPPQNILCLTYTKSAAAEMQIRLFDRLGKWAMLPDDRLGPELAALGADAGADLARVRTLFALALEVPGGLRIQTIHSFCAALLRRYPLEAGLAPDFREMDELAAADLRRDIAAGLAEGANAAFLEGLLDDFSPAALDEILSRICGDADAFDGPLDSAVLRSALGLEGVNHDPTAPDELLPPTFLADLPQIQAVLALGGPKDQEFAAALSEAVTLMQAGRDPLPVLVRQCLVGSKSVEGPAVPKKETHPAKAQRMVHPEIGEAIDALCARVAIARDHGLRVKALERSLTLHRFARAYLSAYAAEKARRGVLDFDDLVRRATQLVSDPDVADWVLYRLDGKLDHILIDEAQDTAPGQWALIRRLTEALRVGADASARRSRSLFVVGDRKQSIYSFQGADAASFQRVRTEMQLSAGRGLEVLRLDASFRSSDAILRVVDASFAAPHHSGLEDTAPAHFAFFADLPGRVDLWPPVVADKADAPPFDWTDPVDLVSPDHPHIRLARQIAERIGRMLGEHRPTLPRDGTVRAVPITPGDILILVQKRSGIFQPLIDALKKAGLPVAGEDKINITDALAVQDILALLRFLALQDDDLSLAALLRSPLCGWDEQALFDLAANRAEGATLWQAVRGMSDDARGTRAMLADLRDAAEFLRPHDLIQRILIRHHGRRRLIARLGAECEDAVDALLAQARGYERDRVADLTGFLAWVDRQEIAIKRQMDNEGALIRVMTVHGAKGLEAPVVILADCASQKPRSDMPYLASPAPVLIRGNKAEREGILQAREDTRKQADAAEDDRLLYVAMTRAQSWLIVCAAGDVGTGRQSWHGIVSSGMDHLGAVAATNEADGVRRYAMHDWDGLPRAAAGPAPAPVAAPDLLPDGPLPSLTQDGPLSPSDLGGGQGPTGRE